MAIPRRRAAIGPWREPHGFVKLTGESRLIGIAAFQRQLADRRIALAQAIAGAFDPRPRQILAGGKAEQGADALIELEHREPRARREIGNAQRSVEMVVDIAEHGRQRRDVRLRVR